MARQPSISPDLLSAYLGKLKAVGASEFEGLGFRVRFGEVGELAQLEGSVTAEDIEDLRHKIATRKAKEELQLENWSSDD